MMKKLGLFMIFFAACAVQICADDFDLYYKKFENYEKGSLFMETDISFLVTLVVEKPHEPKKALQYRMFRRDKDDFATIIQLAPEAEKGNGILMAGDNLWVYDPVSRKFTHSSLKEQLGTSDARASDISKQDSFKKRYRITAAKNDMLGKFPVHIISLDVISKDSDYAKEVYYMRTDEDIVLKTESYGANGRLMRSVLFPKYTKVAGHIYPAQIIIRDEINKGEITTQVLSDFSVEAIPAKVFTKAYLEQIN